MNAMKLLCTLPVNSGFFEGVQQLIETLNHEDARFRMDLLIKDKNDCTALQLVDDKQCYDLLMPYYENTQSI